jgi:predicted 3-demethylubiquinone-9 3-methyltransferase (glyoxalase superfamily)
VAFRTTQSQRFHAVFRANNPNLTVWQPFTGLNGGPLFKFNEAVSFQIPVETQAEVDRLSDALSAVPEAEQCGWVKDRYGLSWQIVRRQLTRLIGRPTTHRLICRIIAT